MQNKDIVIIALIVVIIYLAYQQNQPNLLGNSEEKIQDLQQQVQHYQTLYENRVKKDLGFENKGQETQTNEDQLIIQHQEQLRKINVLFDPNAQNYETINFQGLYSLLEKIAQDRQK